MGQWGGGDEASICVSLLQASHLCEALNPDFLSIQDTGCPEIFEGVNGSFVGLFSVSMGIMTQYQCLPCPDNTIRIKNTESHHFYK